MFPDLQIAVVIVKDIDNHIYEPIIADMLRGEEQFCRNIFSEQKVSEHPNIKSWRKAYTKFGAGSHYRSSVEALVKRVQRAENIPTINNLVDIYNLISLKYLVPVGGEDLKAISGDIKLTFASGKERFRAIYSQENDPPVNGEIVYLDNDNDVLCRRFNWREADKSKITENTTSAIIYIEGITPVNAIELKEAALDLATNFEKFCGGSSEFFLVNKEFPIFTFRK